MKNIETILKEAGVEVTPEVLEKVKAGVNENYKTINDYNNQVDKIKTLEDTVETTKETLKTTQEELKKFEGVDTEALNQQIKDLQTTIENNKSEYESKIADRDFNDLITKSISDKKGKNTKAIMALLDIDELKASKNQKEDIEKAINGLVEAEDSKMLFGEPDPNPVGKGNPIGSVKKDGNGANDESLHDAISSYYGK